MREVAPEERLQPSLLDRLTDDEPEKLQESRDKRVLSMRKLREAVLRDLAWLLNTGNLGSSADLTECPSVADAVVNYGVPDLAGFTQSSLDPVEVERSIARAITNFEPRIVPGTLAVRAHATDGDGSASIAFIIEGELWAETITERLFLKTEVDLETGEFTLVAGDG